MEYKSILSTLEDLGLSEKEAKIYFSSLKIGPATILQLARESGVKRSTVYSIIDSLKAKHLIRKDIYGLKELFAAADPETLETLLEERKRSFHKVLPELSALQHLSDSGSVIKYYDGIEALKQVYREMLKLVRIGEDYLVLSSGEKFDRLASDFLTEFFKKRGRLDINVRMILTDSEWARKRAGSLKEPNERNRILPDHSSLSTNLVIIPSRVLIHQLVPPVMGMVIENPPIIKMHREMFELIWNSLPDSIF